MLKIKPMVYQIEGKIELLYNDIYKNYHYYILNLGTHPTAYIEIPRDSELFGKDYDEIVLDVHGGLTYSSDKLRTSEGTIMKESWFIGGDYAHCDDYCGYEERFPENLKTYGKKWSTEEIIKECEEAINQIIEKVD